MNYYCKDCSDKKGLEYDANMTAEGWGGYCAECGKCDLFYSSEIAIDIQYGE